MKKSAFFYLLLSAIFLVKTSEGQNIGIGHNVAEGLLDLNGDLILRSAGITLPNGNSIAVDVESNPFSNFRISGPTDNFSIGGITSSPDGKLLSFFNNSGQIMTILHENTAALPTDRILTGTGNNIIIPHNASISLSYNGSAERWVVTGNSAPIPSSGQVSWITNDTRMYNTNAGNVGIGTQFPGSKLSVAGNGYFSGTNPNLALEPVQESYYMNTAGLQIASPNTDNYPVGIQNNILAINGNQIQSYVRDIDDPSESDLVRTLVINPLGGNVGIGTSTPAAGAKTTIETGDFTTALLLRNTSNSVRLEAYLGGAANGNAVSLGTPGAMPIALYTNATNRMVIAANGNIGIGPSTNPDTKLHVQGSIKMTGAMYEPIRTIYGDGTYDIEPDDYNFYISVPNYFDKTIYFNLPPAYEHRGRVLNFSATSLPRVLLSLNELRGIGSSVRFNGCLECPVLEKVNDGSKMNILNSNETTCITLQSDGTFWRLTKTNHFNYTLIIP